MNRRITELDADYAHFVKTGLGYITGMSPQEFGELESGFAQCELDATQQQEVQERIDYFRSQGRGILRAAGIHPDDYFCELPIAPSTEEIAQSRLPENTEKFLGALGTSSAKVVQITENLPLLLVSGAALRGDIKPLVD